MGNKQIRDPLYNYIELEEPFVQLIDTPEFQRLRNIRQTSYEALYPSALHNRFVHSLGVFHLGKKAIDSFWNHAKGVISEAYLKRLAPEPNCERGEWIKIRGTFLYACLLHDVGHSPFSHTGEQYYRKGMTFDVELEKAVCRCQDLVAHKAGDHYLGKQFCEDMAISTVAPGAPHEAMSALIGLELCEKFGLEIDRELFVRCIIGVKYLAKLEKGPKMSQEEMTFLNAVIGLLNGNLIDVDKLDYTIRDSYVTGYNNLSIDLDRILTGYTLFQEDGKYRIGYMKGSLSVIENVIYANDLERRWIQNHPTVQYDNQLVDTLLGRFDAHMREAYEHARKEAKETTKSENLPGSIATIFQKQSLSQAGMPGSQPPLKLLNDADILAYIKNVDTSEAGRQYFNRAARLKPLWKTEAAFIPLSKDFGPSLMWDIQTDFNDFLNTLQGRGEPFINQEALDYLQDLFRDQEKTKYQQAVEICKIFQKFQEDNNLPDFQFLLAQTKRFHSNYRKVSSATEPVMVELDSGYFPLEEVMSIQAKETAKNMSKDFFYVYTTQRNIQAQKNLGVKFFDCLRRNYHRAV